MISAEEGFYADPEAVALLQTVQVRKRISFAPFYTKHDHFTKTGSAQTSHLGKSLKERERCVFGQMEHIDTLYYQYLELKLCQAVLVLHPGFPSALDAEARERLFGEGEWLSAVAPFQ